MLHKKEDNRNSVKITTTDYSMTITFSKGDVINILLEGDEYLIFINNSKLTKVKSKVEAFQSLIKHYNYDNRN